MKRLLSFLPLPYQRLREAPPERERPEEEIEGDRSRWQLDAKPIVKAVNRDSSVRRLKCLCSFFILPFTSFACLFHSEPTT